jgi:hypothetical protein
MKRAPKLPKTSASCDWEGSIYQPTSSTDPIRCYQQLPRSEYSVGYDGPGWYFWDRTWRHIHGPFSTLEQCQAALRSYNSDT